MRPLHERVIAFEVGPWIVVNFGLFAAAGGALAAWVVTARLQQAGQPPQLVPWLAVGVPVLALIGSRLYALVALEWRAFLAAPLKTLMRTTLAWQGGFFLATAGVIALAAWWRLDPMVLMDAFAFGLPIGQGVGRIGCHTYGCCHGRPTTSRFAITVHEPTSKVVWGSHLGGVPLIPAQLVSAGANAVLALGLAGLALAGPLPIGSIAVAYLVADGVKRLLLETIRGIPSPRFLGLTPFAWTAVVQAVVGLALVPLVHGSVDFTGPLPLVDALSPYLAVVFVAMLLLFGVHRGRPGTV